jgi:hypothetical protein
VVSSFLTIGFLIGEPVSEALRTLLAETACDYFFSAASMSLERGDVVDAGVVVVTVIVAEGPKGEILHAEFKISGDGKDECFYSLRAAMEAVSDSIKDATVKATGASNRPLQL